MASHLQIDVTVWRGRIAESRHRVQAAVCAPDGALTARTEDPGLVTTLRSAAKPFQLLPFVERGHADRFGFGPEQLAVMAASHSGSPYHVELVRGILNRIGCTEHELACGYHDPSDADSAERLRLHPEERSPVYNNCSGKHAGMLALAACEGWPLKGYERAEHPLQQLMLRTVAELCGVDPGAVGTGVDGCSVVVFAVPLAAMARGFARFATAGPAGDPRGQALGRIREAMREFPRATSGRGRLSTVLMERLGGGLVAKGGAEGLECVALPSRGLGVALKVEDGHGRASGPAVLALLDQLGVLSPGERDALVEFRRPVLRNHAGLDVGHLDVEVAAGAPASA